ncbi:MAG: metalloregulator ArsR/SmtB family transcription factor [Acidobacteria bacterium]|jgi:ArsR family transcriptional regulator|nr:metalloregulator ArsR/SmtB family transcription factor [Acidobacteriota bacterium]
MNYVAAPRQLVGRMEALADPIRLRLLRLLERHELGVAELCAIVQLPQSTVSRHLKLLADQGWVASHREGTSNLYRLAGDELDHAPRALWGVVREEAARWPSSRQDDLRLERRLEQRRQESLSFFAGAAASWDALRAELFGDGFARAALLALLPPDWIVADLGCGTGALVAELAGAVRRVVGVDQSAEMLAAARERVAGLSNVELHEGDLGALPLADACCDAALMLLSLAYAPQPGAALGELARVLKPGGRAVIVDLLPHDSDDARRRLGQAGMGFAPASLRALAHRAGLNGVHVTTLPPAPEARGPALFLATAHRKTTGPLAAAAR